MQRLPLARARLLRCVAAGVALAVTLSGISVAAEKASDASSDFKPGGPLTPAIASDWFRIVEYPDHHLNDSCLFRDRQGTWHAIGIIGTGTWGSEVTLFHSTAKSLKERFPSGRRAWFAELEDVHAAEIVEHDGRYYITRLSGPTHANRNAPKRGGWMEVAELQFLLAKP